MTAAHTIVAIGHAILDNERQHRDAEHERYRHLVHAGLGPASAEIQARQDMAHLLRTRRQLAEAHGIDVAAMDEDEQSDLYHDMAAAAQFLALGMTDAEALAMLSGRTVDEDPAVRAALERFEALQERTAARHNDMLREIGVPADDLL